MTKALALAAMLAAAFAPPLADAQDFEDRHILPNVFEDGLSNIEGFIRIHNLSLDRAPVKLSAYDDAGVFWGDRTIFLDSSGATHFNSGDLENGNPDKGLEGFGNGSGRWTLVIEGPIFAGSYARTSDGFLTAMHTVARPVPNSNEGLSDIDDYKYIYVIPIFNPGRNRDQVSILRVKNMENYEHQCALVGFDDAAEQAGRPIGFFTLGAGVGAEYTALELEDLIGDGGGKWYFLIFCDRILVSSLLHSRPTGYITNLTNAAVESPALRDFTSSQLERIRQAFTNSNAIEIRPSPSPTLH